MQQSSDKSEKQGLGDYRVEISGGAMFAERHTKSILSDETNENMLQRDQNEAIHQAVVIEDIPAHNSRHANDAGGLGEH